jgi:hypothetical protein
MANKGTRGWVCDRSLWTGAHTGDLFHGPTPAGSRAQRVGARFYLSERDVDRIPRTSFVAAVLGEDPADAPLVRCLTGYLGNSAVDGHTRIYLTLDLDQWIDVADSDVLYVAEPPETAASAGSLIWIRAGAIVRPKPTSDDATTLERYFAGDVYRDWPGRGDVPGGDTPGDGAGAMAFARRPMPQPDPDAAPTRIDRPPCNLVS